MTQIESSVWKLFKHYFVDSDFVEKATCCTLIGMRIIIKRMLERIEREIEKFEN